MSEDTRDDAVALILAGGGARGAYEVGALARLLPALEELGQRPRLYLGNSVGAINSTYLAATAHLPAAQAIAQGKGTWETLRFADVFKPFFPGAVGRGVGYLGQFLGVPHARLEALLDPTPLYATAERIIDFDDLTRNVEDQIVDCAAVVATSGLSRRSVVFHQGGHPASTRDPGRQIDYVETRPLAVEHILASAAIPAVFPAVDVNGPDEGKGWYFDGGTRLNVPFKPAVALGASRVVAIGLDAAAIPQQSIAGANRPDALAGIGQLVKGLLVDQMVEDVRTLADINVQVKLWEASGNRPHGGWKVVPYILVTPEKPDEIELIAYEVFRKRYRRVLGTASASLALLGRATGANTAPENATLLSMLMFDQEFIERLIALGERDAQRWLDRKAGLWQVRPL